MMLTTRDIIRTEVIERDRGNMTKHAYWIHHAVKDETQVDGYKYLMNCDCSNCGYAANLEKPVCPSCGAVMDEDAPKGSMVEDK
jgi:lipopolysaccharide biosynthesis regulator YciM